MKITRVETFQVPPRWCFVRIETDNGLVGWGEPVIEGKAASVAAIVDELSDVLIGADPRRINDLWTVMYRGGFYRGGPHLMSAIAGIDQALWDITAKSHDTSVADMLGGRLRDSIRVYSWIGGDRPGETAAAAKAAVDRGFTAVKMNGTDELDYLDTPAKVRRTVENVTAIREAVGPDVGIAVDFHGRVHRPMMKVLLDALAPLGLMFVEEPVLSEHLDGVADILKNAPMPIALGERLFSRWDFKAVMSSGAVDVIQPDPCHSGGITETVKIASMAEAYDVALAPHCPLGPIALATCLAIDAVSYNAVIQEQSLGIHYNTTNDLLDYLVDPSVFAYADGVVAIPDGPGLGVEIDEEYVRDRAAEGHRWRNPLWRHADGRVAEW